MLSRELEVSLNLALKDARAQRHELMSVEHLLLALLDNTAAVTVLSACNADVEKLKHRLRRSLLKPPLLSQKIRTAEKRNRRSDFSVSCSARYSMYRAPARKK